MAIDWWTLGLQTANFLVLIWLLQRFLYRPVLAIIARRQAEIATLMGQADTAKTAAETLERELATQRATLAAERDHVLDAARVQAERERQAALTKAQADADALVANGRRALAQERQDAAGVLQKDAAALGIGIARNLLANMPPQAPGTFLDGIYGTIADMGADERKRLIPGGDGVTVRVVTAQPLADADRVACRTKLAALLGKDMPLSFANDPQLLAGAELHFPNSILRNTWRDALDVTLETVIHDGQARGNA
jgi:F-type H+-transporting ATPase subunit b